MSLLDSFLRDALLQTVVQSDVFFANRTDGASGAGTELNPYSAAGSATDSDPPFDKLMRAIPENTTVRLLPGTYYTNGYCSGYNPANQGWRPKNGVRIVGASVNNTTLKLTNNRDDHLLTSLVGSDPTSQSHFLEAFELENLTLDCSITGTQTTPSTAGVTVNGRNIYIHDLVVKNFEKKGNSACHGISFATAYNTGTYTLIPENCVLDSCRVETAVGTNGAIAIRMVSDTNGYYHKFCVVRNCYVSLLSSSTSWVGIAASGGLGTIIEHNRVVNCGYGIAFCPSSGPALNSTRDLIIRHNYLASTLTGLNFNLLTSGRNCERLILLNNVVDWADATANPVGVAISGSADIVKLIIRDNICKRQGGVITGGETGLDLNRYVNAVVENNLLDVSNVDYGVRHPNSGTLKIFNNLRSDGTLLRGYNTVTQLRDSELTTDVEDVYLAL